MEPEKREPPHSTEEWQLKGGGTRYAPEHPLHLDVPGFWDEVQIDGQSFWKLLCVSFVLDAGEPISAGPEGLTDSSPKPVELDPYLSYWYWYPDRIEARYYLVRRQGIGYKQQAGVRVFMDEMRYIADDGSLNCAISFELLKQHPAQLQVVAWGLDTQLSAPDGLPPAGSASALVSGAVVPKLVHTPFFNMLESGGLHSREGGGRPQLSALHWKVELSATEPVVIHVQAMPDVK